ncbi:MAG: 3-deoxy-8-phosphooctulonate synthase [Helicobacteraceae bacterium]|jgi:2-dehydro-3-deoxyphosphooctonate aldolase (KDO 8-P synthase)|nr:3-deoxy-8-phosphooctulonate synthase [Helicobacteraceae bacterium]
MKSVRVVNTEKDVIFANNLPIAVIAGPCVIESAEFSLRTAERLKAIFDDLDMGFIYKSSFDKANRSSASSFRGVGLEEGLRILESVRREVGVAVLTDVHTEDQVKPVSEVADMLQTPAFLCRQTDFISTVAAAKKPVNIKKGQFLSPWEMKNVLKKALLTGNEAISLCERGATFGYNNLVVDMRSLAILSETSHPVIFDATHSVQLPGAAGGASGGQREFAPVLARAAVGAKVAGVFLETHPNPDLAPCDGPNMIPFSELPALLRTLKKIDEAVKI